MLSGSQSGNAHGQSRWARPLRPLALILAAAVALLYLGGFISARSIGVDAVITTDSWIPAIIAGAVIIYGLYAGFADAPIWQVGRREVWAMLIGAVLTGLIAWATDIIWSLPAFSLVSLRPAAVIPIFLGVLFGPVVGFFCGLGGAILGDALSGWGVTPLRDVGTGLMGLIAGLALAFRGREQPLNLLSAIVGGLTLLTTAIMVINWNAGFSDFVGNEYIAGPLFWIPLLGGSLILAVRYLPARDAQIAGGVLWGAIGVFVGVGLATFGQALLQDTPLDALFFGEFVPTTGSILINLAILLPLLLVLRVNRQV